MPLLHPTFEWLTSEPQPPPTEATTKHLKFVNNLVRSIRSSHFYSAPAVSICYSGGGGTKASVYRPSPPGYCYTLSMFFHKFHEGIVFQQSQKSQGELVLLIVECRIDSPIIGYYLCMPRTCSIQWKGLGGFSFTDHKEYRSERESALWTLNSHKQEDIFLRL